MEPWQERLVVETQELQERITKLLAFTANDTFARLNTGHQKLLFVQLDQMVAYYTTLCERVSLIKQKPLMSIH